MAKKIQIVSGRPFQEDWNMEDETNVAYIRNKPKLSDNIKLKNIVLSASAWSYDVPYIQQIELDVTPNSKVDIQPNVDVISATSAVNSHLLIKNDNGNVAIYALNNKPLVDLNLQLSITEVTRENDIDVIWGNGI